MELLAGYHTESFEWSAYKVNSATKPSGWVVNSGGYKVNGHWVATEWIYDDIWSFPAGSDGGPGYYRGNILYLLVKVEW